MDINFLTNNFLTPSTLVPALINQWKPYYQYEAFKDYEPEFHDVLDQGKRLDRYEPVPNPDGKTLPDGSPQMMPSVTKVTRTPLSLQKIIVQRAVTFLTGGGISLQSKVTELPAPLQAVFNMVNTTWDRNKCEYDNAGLAETVLSQLEMAEIWYSEVGQDKKVRMKVKYYSPGAGYDLIPVFDRSGDLIAFGMRYTEFDAEGKERQFFDLYTDGNIHKYIDYGGWILREDLTVNPIVTSYGKIPVVYWSVPKSAWKDVQWLIDQLEKVMSNFGDTNLYNGNPILFTKAEQLESLPAKDQMGKAIHTTDSSGDAKYVSIDSIPEMVKFEKESLETYIYSLTQTPNISFDSMKGLGDLSGAALKRLLIDAYMKANRAQIGWYGKGMQRRINLLVSACASILNVADTEDLYITPEFHQYDIFGETDRVELALLANGGRPVLSQRESIDVAGLSKDADMTFETIKAELPESVGVTGRTPA